MEVEAFYGRVTWINAKTAASLPIFGFI